MSSTAIAKNLLRQHALLLFARHTRPTATRLVATILVLGLSPVVWTAFAVNNFLSEAPILTKIVRLQSVVATDELFRELCDANWTGFSSVHETQFSFFSPPALLVLLASEVLPLDRQRIASNSFPMRLDTTSFTC